MTWAQLPTKTRTSIFRKNMLCKVKISYSSCSRGVKFTIFKVIFASSMQSNSMFKLFFVRVFCVKRKGVETCFSFFHYNQIVSGFPSRNYRIATIRCIVHNAESLVLFNWIRIFSSVNFSHWRNRLQCVFRLYAIK